MNEEQISALAKAIASAVSEAVGEQGKANPSLPDSPAPPPPTAAPGAASQSGTQGNDAIAELSKQIEEMGARVEALTESRKAEAATAQEKRQVSALPPAGAKSGTLTMEDVRAMTQEQINAQWDDVQSVLASAPRGE